MSEATKYRPIEEMTYDQATAETELLLQELEKGQLPISEVLDKSRRVVELIAFCRKEIAKIGTEVNQILDDLREKNDTA